MQAAIAATAIKIAIFVQEEGLRLTRGLLLALDFEVGSDILKTIWFIQKQ